MASPAAIVHALMGIPEAQITEAQAQAVRGLNSIQDIIASDLDALMCCADLTPMQCAHQRTPAHSHLSALARCCSQFHLMTPRLSTRGLWSGQAIWRCGSQVARHSKTLSGRQTPERSLCKLSELSSSSCNTFSISCVAQCIELHLNVCRQPSQCIIAQALAISWSSISSRDLRTGTNEPACRVTNHTA